MLVTALAILLSSSPEFVACDEEEEDDDGDDDDEDDPPTVEGDTARFIIVDKSFLSLEGRVVMSMAISFKSPRFEELVEVPVRPAPGPDARDPGRRTVPFGWLWSLEDVGRRRRRESREAFT